MNTNDTIQSDDKRNQIEQTRKTDKQGKFEYSVGMKVVAVLTLLLYMHGFFLTLPTTMDFESIRQYDHPGIFILNIVLVNLARVAMIIATVFVFLGNRKALVAALITFLSMLAHSFCYGLPEFGWIYYTFSYNHLRLYVYVIVSFVFLVLVFRRTKRQTS